jgi:hypothetical protein
METYMHRKFVFGVLCAWMAACGETTTNSSLSEKYASYVDRVVPVSELLATSPNGWALLDLQNSSDGFWVQHGVDHSSIDVICPSGRYVNLKSWIPELTAEIGEDFSNTPNGFVMFTQRVSAQNAPVCQDGCYAHRENGTWVCLCSVE